MSFGPVLLNEAERGQEIFRARVAVRRQKGLCEAAGGEVEQGGAEFVAGDAHAGGGFGLPPCGADREGHLGKLTGARVDTQLPGLCGLDGEGLGARPLDLGQRDRSQIRRLLGVSIRSEKHRDQDQEGEIEKREKPRRSVSRVCGHGDFCGEGDITLEHFGRKVGAKEPQRCARRPQRRAKPTTRNENAAAGAGREAEKVPFDRARRISGGELAS